MSGNTVNVQALKAGFGPQHMAYSYQSAFNLRWMTSAEVIAVEVVGFSGPPRQRSLSMRLREDTSRATDTRRDDRIVSRVWISTGGEEGRSSETVQ